MDDAYSRLVESLSTEYETDLLASYQVGIRSDSSDFEDFYEIFVASEIFAIISCPPQPLSWK